MLGTQSCLKGKMRINFANEFSSSTIAKLPQDLRQLGL